MHKLSLSGPMIINSRFWGYKNNHEPFILTSTFLARGYFNRLLLSLNPDKDRQKIGPDLDPNLISVSDIFFFMNKLILKKSADDIKSTKNLTCKEIKITYS